MSLKPTNLAVTDYPVALKPTLGYEQQLYTSPQAHTVLGSLDVVAPNSGTYTLSVPDNAMLAVTPQELFMALDADADLGTADLVVTVVGTDQNNAALTGTCTFTPPGHAQDQSHAFPRGWAQEVTATAGKKFKTITGISVVTDAAIASTPRIWLIGIPSLDSSSSGTFTKLATKVKLNYDPAVPIPTAVQDGRRKGAYIKKGEIEVGKAEITAKIPGPADGLARVNGRRVTGWIQEKKEEKLVTQNIFLLGLVLGAKAETGEGAEPMTLTGEALYEVFAFIVAHYAVGG